MPLHSAIPAGPRKACPIPTARHPRPAISPVRLYLHLEGAAIALLAAAAYAQTGWGWGIFAALLLAPDLAIAAYAAGPRAGAAAYNAAHSYFGPAVLVALSGVGIAWAWPAALIWAAHISIDRSLGYGLKYGTKFKDTHLARL